MNTWLTRSWRAASSLPRATSRAAQAVCLPQARRASVLVVADPLSADGHLSVATQSAVTAATTWLDARDDDAPHHCVLLTTGVTPPTSRALPAGVTAHTHAVTTTANFVVETAAAAIVQAATGASATSPDLVVGAATKWGSSVLPRAAALLQVSPVPDVVAILDAHTYIRPLYAGNALAKVQAQADARCQVLTIRPTAFAPAPLVVDDSVTVDTMEVKDYDQSVWVSADVSAAGAGRPDLTAAGTVVSGGRGMGAAANFGLLAALADALGNAAVGASRAAVDAGMAPNDQQVGQTGKVVAPDLYVAVGISGAIQHLSGMKDSKVIVAINKDREAPIFQVADYGLVEDLFTAVPALTEQVKS